MAPKRSRDDTTNTELPAGPSIIKKSRTKSLGSRSSFQPVIRRQPEASPSSNLVQNKVSRILTIEDRSSRKGKSKVHASKPHTTSSSAHSIPSIPELQLKDSQSSIIHDMKDFNEAMPGLSTGYSLPQHTGGGKRSYSNKTALKEWLPLRAMYLDELLRHDGLGSHPLVKGTPSLMCIQCKVEGDTSLFKCSDCFDGSLLRCSACLVRNHKCHPLHRIEKWNGQHFEKSRLKDLGSVYQLGHGGGSSCSNPTPGPENFMVIDTGGIHQVKIMFCSCLDNIKSDATLDSTAKQRQLLRSRWFPSTNNRPRSVFTFDVLDTFHELTLQSKTPLYDFYNTILRKSDRLELEKIPTRNNDFQRVFREYRCLILLKRSGCAHNPSGIDKTDRGGAAVVCPACPHPGKNLPEEWKSDKENLFLYTLFLAVDANFKLKGKRRNLDDIELTPGWTYCVEEEDYQSHLDGYKDQPEMNTCHSEHDAIVRAATRATPGYDVTGAGVVMCSRHGLIQPNGVGDLQKGERYANMDYIVLSALVFAASLCRVVITYDIACQWSKNLTQRISTYPESLRKSAESLQIETAVPSWHINGHGPDCQVKFALGYKEGMGCTCGDEIEGVFSHTNSLGASFREMAPAARHEAINDTFSGYNFSKIVHLRSLLRRKLNVAVDMSSKHRDNFERFSSTFDPKLCKKWEQEVLDWESDSSKACPYSEIKCESTLQDVRLQLAKEDAAEAASDAITSEEASNTLSMSPFLILGLELEDQQRALKAERSAKKDTDSSKQQAEFLEKGTSLQRRIRNWQKIQVIHQPYLASQLETSDSDDMTNPSSKLPEEIKLNLPSSLSSQSDVRGTRTATRLVDIEVRLRKAQADDALADIRRLRRAIQRGWSFKKTNLSGQGNKPNTRIRATFNRLNTKIDKAADKYRDARTALELLDPNGSWNGTLLPLINSDISGPAKDDDASKGKYTLSWIWLVQRLPEISSSETAAEKSEVDETLRVEWVKARARHRRWAEELKLVLEEMRRVVAYLEWRASWWLQQCAERNTMAADPASDPSIISGLNAYACKQSALVRLLANSCRKYWLPSIAKHKMAVPWTLASSIDRNQNLLSENTASTSQHLVERRLSLEIETSSHSLSRRKDVDGDSSPLSDSSSDTEASAYDGFELGD